MGTVYLTGNHQGLFIREQKVDVASRVELNADLLARPILRQGGEVIRDLDASMIRGALQGLMDLAGFDAAVSCKVIEIGGVQHIALLHRVWCEITLRDPSNVVVAFTHDSRYDNFAFVTLPNGWRSLPHQTERVKRSITTFSENGHLPRSGCASLRTASAGRYNCCEPK